MNTHATGYNKAKENITFQPLWGNNEPNETSPKEFEFISPPRCNLDFIRLFMEGNHYSRSANVAAMYCFALVSKHRGVVGVAIYSKPAMNSIYKLYADKEEDVVELRRLVCIDDTPKNTESYFVGKTLRWLILNTERKTVVTYADPSFGHVGHAYRACNMKYDGLSGTTVVLELPLDKCVHNGECLAEGKQSCQVHDRNMRCRVKNGTDYTPQAKYLRFLYESKIAKLVPRKAKHRYHYHLAELRDGKPQECRQCIENRKKTTAVALDANTIKVSEKVTTEPGLTGDKEEKFIVLKEASDSYVPKGYIQDDKPSIEMITNKIEKAWEKEMSFWPDKWSSENPACGMCAITALVIQDKLGGDLCRNEVKGYGTHYFNRLPNGDILDLTKKQFPVNSEFSKHVIKKRNEILQYKSVVKRYNLLRERFEKV